MPTIKDIAEKAGVSQGTVSNVLNGRGNVSVEKINLVRKSAEELGYRVNEKAKMLRQGVSNVIAVILPDLETECYTQIYSRIQSHLSQNGYSVRLFLTMDTPALEQNAMKEILGSSVSGIITVSCLPEPYTVYSAAESQNVKTLFLINHPEKDSAFLSFNFYEAAREIAEWVENKGFRHVGLFTGQVHLSSNNEIVQTLLSEFRAKDKAVYHVETGWNDANLNAYELYKTKADVIVTSNIRLAQAAQCAGEYSALEQAPVILAISPAKVYHPQYYYEYQLDYYQLGVAASDYMINWLRHGKRSDDIQRLPCKGMPTESLYKYNCKKNNARVLNLLTIDSPHTHVLSNMLPLCEKQTGIRVNLISCTYEEVYEAAINLGDSGIYDVIRLDMAWLPYFSKILLPFSMDDDRIKKIFHRFLPELINDYCMAQGSVYAFPLDPSIQLLFYRTDLFSDIVQRRAYYEKYNEEIKIPETFEELNRMAAFFTKGCNPYSPTKYGMTMVAGNSGMISCDLLPRMISYLGKENLQQHGIPLTSPLAIRAVENYVDIKNYCPNKEIAFWDAAVDQFVSGDTAMLTVFSNHAARIVTNHSSKISGQIGFAPMPGGVPLLGGGVLGIVRNTKIADTAIQFIDWITNDENAAVFALMGGVSANNSVYETNEILEIYPWLTSVKEGFAYGIGRKGLLHLIETIDEKKMEHILGMAVKNVLQNSMDIAQAMEYAQKLITKLTPN